MSDMASAPAYLGLDIGKTKLAVAVVDGVGTVYTQSQVATPLSSGGPTIIAHCRELVREARRQAPLEVAAIGIGASGVVDHKRGIIRSSGSIPNWTDIPLKQDFEDEFGLPVHVDNDVYAAALGEAILGAGRGSRSSAFLTISTGVGFGAVHDHQIWRGAHSLSGQIAHMTGLAADTTATVNDLFSGAGIARAASQALNAELSTSDVFRAAAAGDKTTSAIVARAALAAGTVVAWIQASLDPEVIVLGGTVSVANAPFVSQIRREAAARLSAYTKQLSSGPVIVVAELGSDAGVIGSALLCTVS